MRTAVPTFAFLNMDDSSRRVELYWLVVLPPHDKDHRPGLRPAMAG